MKQILVVNPDIPFYSDIAIYDDKVSLVSLKGYMSGVLIENKEVADTFCAIFKLINDDL